MLFRKQEKRSTYTLQDAEMAELLGIEVDGISSNKMKEATYFTCMKILMETVSKLPLKLHKETNNGVEKATNHYLYNLLKLRPNPYMSSSSFWKMCEFQRNEHGHAIIYIDSYKGGKNAGKVKGLYPLDMRYIEVWVDDKGIIGKNNALWYVYRDGKGNEYKLKDENILHFLGLTGDGITGMAVKDYLKVSIENAQSGQQYTNNYFKGGLFAKGILQYTGDISPENQKKMQSRFEGMASGIKNAGKILPVPLGFSYQSINSTMADAQFLEINELTIRQIASAFGIKMHQINELSRATHSNVAEMQKSFYIDTLQATLTMIEQELSYKLLTEKEREQGYFFEFNVDSILRSSFETRIEALGKAVDKGIYTINEARQVENKSRIDHKYADSLIFNGNAIPIDMLGQQYLKNSPTEGGENNNE